MVNRRINLNYNTDHGYYYQHPYYPTSSFRHVNITNNGVKLMRFGVLGKNDGLIRLSPIMYPYDGTEMFEIVLSGWANTKTVVRRYKRTSPSEHGDEDVLKEQSSIGMLSVYEPFMFTMAVHPNGLVQLTRDGDSDPFLEFRDPKFVSAKHVGFCNWDVPVVFFYDCPLEVDQSLCDGVVMVESQFHMFCSIRNPLRGA
ncbi:uncharacterized protein LOC129770597 isoform X2 [Toxorhynchites rutilus septentrionalis]|uniref:uncharacterized protein LOC129770597 isoform X2 n=1 Tax=Toxorhynchites rutilus septentrionalis TaxID=329112 RepID=UPI00247AD3D2|nr:uncharacterized protein LOC129770597 isoform X2 [Toxorhynchites rutilus septentrionalis]